MITVKDLRDALVGLPDEMPVCVAADGCYGSAVYISTEDDHDTLSLFIADESPKT